MKLTICVLLVGGLGLLLGVEGGTARLKDENDLIYFAGNEIEALNVEPEKFGLLSSIWWLIKIVVRTLKGVSCMVEWALGIQQAAEKFSKDIQSCGGNVTSDVQALIDANNAIIGTCKEIIELRQTICKRLTADVEQELEDRSNVLCYVKSVALFMRLMDEVNEAVTLAKQIPTTGADASKCVSSSVNELTEYFTKSEAIIEECIDSSK